MRTAAMQPSAPVANSLVGLVCLICLICSALPVGAQAAGEPAGQEVWLGDELTVTYLARVEGDWLIVEARHEPGWHTYAMDNPERAAAATGSSTPETELPTRIEPSPEIELRGPWRQTAPTDLSDPEIRWYTWGFEGRSFFAAPVERAEPGAWVAVGAQACTDKLCAMVEDLRVPVTAGGEPSVDPATLEAVGGAGEAPAGSAGVRERLAEFGDWFQRALDVECSGKVSAARLVKIMTPGLDRPRQMNWVMALDADEDGFLEPGEAGEGLWSNLVHQVARRMVGDVDGDEVLSAREYALFVPDPGKRTNEDGVSELQERLFADLDGDGDRLVTREEIAENFGKGYIARHWAHAVAFHLGRADADGDGAVDADELARAVEAAGGVADRSALDGWFKAVVPNASEPRLVVSELLTTALTAAAADAEGRQRLEEPLGALLSPACPAR